jgi:dTDP-4-dehydrorhamnose 3,5-epimerase
MAIGPTAVSPSNRTSERRICGGAWREQAVAGRGGCSLNFAESPAEIAGVRWGRVQAHNDERGAFREICRASIFADLTVRDAGAEEPRFVQANLSFSRTGVLRGLHYHRRQLDHWVVIHGTVFVALVDLRSSERRPTLVTRVLGTDDSVTIPLLVAHGFLALRPTNLLYFVTNEYDGTDEYGLAWNDPTVGVPWPDLAGGNASLIVSPRDRANPSLAGVQEALQSA